MLNNRLSLPTTRENYDNLVAWIENQDNIRIVKALADEIYMREAKKLSNYYADGYGKYYKCMTIIKYSKSKEENKAIAKKIVKLRNTWNQSNPQTQQVNIAYHLHTNYTGHSHISIPTSIPVSDHPLPFDLIAARLCVNSQTIRRKLKDYIDMLKCVAEISGLEY